MSEKNVWDDDLGMRKVTTWQAPNGSKVMLTEAQASKLGKANIWPRNASGEYCSVSYGAHQGYPTWSDEYIDQCAMSGCAP